MRKSLLIGLAASVGLVAAAPASASADDTSPTLASILLSDSAKDDGDGFDRRWWDYDIVTQAVLGYDTLVAAASDPEAQLTVFLPNDGAFRRLVEELTGERVRSEADVFAAVASLGPDTVLDVLLYHVVPMSISYRDALGADDAALDTLLPGAQITVDVNGRNLKYVQLGDLDADDRDPIVVRPNVGGPAANGYAHGIDRVLRPMPLP